MKGFKQAGMVAILAIGVGATGTAQAAFYVRGEGMVYDSDHNLTWLKDANFAQTSGFDADGLMDWQTANDWANSLTIGGYTDWRLWQFPAGLSNDAIYCYGMGCNSGELADLYFGLGGGSADPIAVTHISNYELFDNVKSNVYWSSVKSPGYWNDLGTSFIYSDNHAWMYATVYLGYQMSNPLSTEAYAWAVRDGDVANAAIPEPSILWLFLAASVCWQSTTTPEKQTVSRSGSRTIQKTFQNWGQLATQIDLQK